MKSNRLFLLISLCIVFSCDIDDEISRDEEWLVLQNILSDLQEIATSEPCNDASIWTYTPYGDKPCGGPWGYIAYPNTIDVEMFLAKVEAHRIENENFNRKWNEASDCAFEVEPIDIICENGEAVLIFQ